MQILLKEKLEKTLMANWSNFIDYRALLNFSTDIARNNLKNEVNCQVQKITISRFELIPNGFLLWIEITTNSKNNITVEALMDSEGNLMVENVV